ncbi:hypothetical protein SISSUDRAFT_1061263 [Sistotremastrum suecicum HHB10207 ss-3]|uniref:Nephrocystin 3-like N-terminal domain-containing protein n=1 Tax=Sistotremastrum suecicum HHB10207 ss-3 TaxID=1314776 RepID=A0A166E908_9AGAM|nr:hypothetical protein SISSUDRAFT_1061263 [Sistotremastrum suecicum HHB10207 ss-3]
MSTGTVKRGLTMAAGKRYGDGSFELRFKVDMMGQESNLGRRRLESVVPVTLAPDVDLLGNSVLHAEAFLVLVGEITEIQPYVRPAWSALATGFKLLQEKMQLVHALDDDMVELLQAIIDTSSLVTESLSQQLQIESLLESHKKIIEKIVHQITQCGYFMQQYAHPENQDFVSRAVKTIPSTRQMSQKFVLNLEKFRRAFKDRDTLEIEIVWNFELWQHQYLGAFFDQPLPISQSESPLVGAPNDIPFVKGASFVPDRGCLPSTRIQIIEELSQWAAGSPRHKDKGNHESQDESDPEDIELNSEEDGTVNNHRIDGSGLRQDSASTGASLIWLTGFPGAGKSAIAHTIAQRFHSLGRLGSSFFFDKSDANRRSALAVFPQISRNLAHINPEWKAELDRMADNPKKLGHELHHTNLVQQLFEEFVLSPSQRVEFFGPMFIVIDALDECQDDAARVGLLTSLSKRLHELPSNFRILVTSRWERAIEDALIGTRNVTHRSLDAAAQADLEIYYRTMFRRHLPEFDERWPNGIWMKDLIKRSEGIFRWASMACKFVLEPGEVATNRLHDLLATTDHKFEVIDNQSLDALYTGLLQRFFPFIGEDDDQTAHYRAVLGRCLCTHGTSTLSLIIELRGSDEGPRVAESILGRMGSLLKGAGSNYHSPVQTIHSSFREFLLDKQRSHVYHVDPLVHEKALAKACLSVMDVELRFDIWQMKASYTGSYATAMKPPDVEDATIWLKAHVSDQLLYASQFWSNHLIATEFDPELADLLRIFCRTKFTYWLELLALHNLIHEADSHINRMVEWAMNHDEKLVNFGKDAEKFMTNYCAQ